MTLVELLLAVLLAALVAGAAAPGIVLAVRALPPVARLVEAGVKPWACDVCSSFWTTALAVAIVVSVTNEARLLLAAGPAYTLALFVLARLQAAPEGGAPSALPDLPPAEPERGP